LYQRATPPAVVNVRLSGMAMACLSRVEDGAERHRQDAAAIAIAVVRDDSLADAGPACQLAGRLTS